MSKFIFVSGGVVSGLGKGISAASLGRLLKARGLKVSAMKLDPYINIDPGTMSPYQHGEVFVTEDGSETDLDLGHYERFIDENLNRYSNVTTGKVYWNVLNKEREGKYLGETVQVIPHITNEIKDFIYKAQEESGADIMICEIGGTTGDIESLPFLEAIRQVAQDKGRENCLFLHVTLIPYLESSGEHKSKPAQHSVNQLQSYGIFPDIIIARCSRPLEEGIRDKLSLFCNIPKECVFENRTMPSLYEVPYMLQKQGLDDVVCRKFHIDAPQADLRSWSMLMEHAGDVTETVTIALIGKYVRLHDAYLSVVEALYHVGLKNNIKVHIKWIDSENITEGSIRELLQDCSGILIPGGFGTRGIEGKIRAATYAREHNIPYLGICLGMQIAAIAFARSVLGYSDANSYEFQPESSHLIIHYMADQSDEQDMGGTMRLGAYPSRIKEGTQLYRAYRTTEISERHRHRYEFNNQFREEFIQNGMDITATSQDGSLVEAVECVNNDFYVGVQFHPEFKSRPNRPHPLFTDFIAYSKANRK